MLRWIGLAVLLLVLAAIVYVRAARYDAGHWHVAAAPRPDGDYPGEKRFEAVRTATLPADDVLVAIDRVALETPRTTRVSGSPESGLMTYETRSALMGYPDYTTVTLFDDGASVRVSIFARSRFGKRDLGVNRARVEDWLDRLGPVLAPAP